MFTEIILNSDSGTQLEAQELTSHQDLAQAIMIQAALRYTILILPYHSNVPSVKTSEKWANVSYIINMFRKQWSNSLPYLCLTLNYSDST